MKFITIAISLALALTVSALNRTPVRATKNYQEADGILGGLAPAVTKIVGALPYQVAGGDAFEILSDALAQSCSIQDQICAGWVDAQKPDPDLELVDCEDQNTDCVTWFDPDPKEDAEAYGS